MGLGSKRRSPDSLHLQLSDDVGSVSSYSSANSKRRQTLAHIPRSPGFFSTHMFRRTSYRRKDSDDMQEMAHLNDDNAEGNVPSPISPPYQSSQPSSDVTLDPVRLSVGTLRRDSIARVPVGSKDVSPISPSSQPDRISSPRVVMRTPTWDRPSTIEEREIDTTHDYPNSSDYTNVDTDDVNHPPSDTATPKAMSGPEEPSQDLGDEAFAHKYGKPYPLTRDNSLGYDPIVNGSTDIRTLRLAEPPTYCASKRDVKVSRTSWLTLTIYFLSVYSTIMSGIWLVVSILQPRWGHQISSRNGLQPASATLLSALAAKTIEISFVTVFVSCLGQVLSRKTFARNSRGITLAEMTMRNWVIQPGSLITHFESLPYAGTTVLGGVSLAATIAALLYTTASDAMVSPKLKYGSWEAKALSGHVRSSYANVGYIKETCTTVLGNIDGNFSADSCLGVQFSGQSYRNLMSFMAIWSNLQENGTNVSEDMNKRPVGTMLLYDNTTMISSWIDTDHSNVPELYKQTGHIINNVTLSFPHPGVYEAATSPLNDILQPDDLGGVGEYTINAAVVSPTINVMCVEMKAEELAPLVYTEWPHARTNDTGVGNQKIGVKEWIDDVPRWTNGKGEPEYLNNTDVDDIFKWGKKYKRRPPVFQLYPYDYNLVINSSSLYESDSLYMLGKNGGTKDYFLCELRSWVTPDCMTQFNISGTTGAKMRAVCGKEWDQGDLQQTPRKANEEAIEPAKDWKWVADGWRLSMDLNGGVYNNNASNARILTQLSLSKPELSNSLPSLAEALAVYASSSIVIGAIDTSFDGRWIHEVTDNILPAPGQVEKFHATLVTQQYTSGHIDNWQKVFYVVLLLVFAINLFCLMYLAMSSGPVTDFTEPQNLFALAINSPPSAQIQGSCGGGPETRDLVVPWRVAHSPSVNHYFFEEANDRPWRGKYAKEGVSSGVDMDTEGKITTQRPSIVMNKV